MDKEQLLSIIVDTLKPQVCKHWKDWGKKEKREWVLSLLVSGSDYSGDIERERLGICLDCYYDKHGHCFKEGETEDDDKICHCFKKECRKGNPTK